MSAIAIEDIREALSEILPPYHVRKAYLFGSQARGDASQESDVDLAFEEYVPYTLDNLHSIEDALEERLGTNVDIISYPGIRSRLFRRSVDRDKVEVYVRDH